MRNKKLQKLSKEVTASKVSILDSNEIKMISGGTNINHNDSTSYIPCSFYSQTDPPSDTCWHY